MDTALVNVTYLEIQGKKLGNLDKNPNFYDAYNAFIASKIKGEVMSKAS